MKVTTLVLNEDGEPFFQGEDQFDIENIIEIAKTREQNARDMGAEWTVGAVTFYGTEVVKAVNTGEQKDLTKAIVNMLMALWLFDSLFGGFTVADYLNSDMKFTIGFDGSVLHSRVAKTN